MAIEGMNFFSKSKKRIDLEAPIIWADLNLGKAASSNSTAAPKVIPEKPAPIVAPPPLVVSKPIKEVVKASPKKTPEPKPTPDLEKIAAEQRRQAMIAALSGVKRQIVAPTADLPSTSSGNKALSNSTQAQLFRQQIKRRMESHLFVTDNEWFGQYRERLVEYFVKIDNDGKVVDLRLRKSSGVDSMDQAVAQAIQRSEPFVPPNADLLELYTKDGFTVHFSPKDLER